MNKIAAAALFAATVAHADPIIEIIDPSRPTHAEHGVITAKDGSKHPAILVTFGSDKCAVAERFGRGLAPMPYTNEEFDKMAYRRAHELYRTEFQYKAFDQIAKNAYNQKMSDYRVTQ